MDAICRATFAGISVSHGFWARSVALHLRIPAHCINKLRTWSGIKRWYPVLPDKELDQRFAPGLASVFGPLPATLESSSRIAQFHLLPAGALQGVKVEIH